MPGPPDFKLLAEQILAFTRVDWDPKNPQVGEQVVVQVIPGILPFVPPEFAGTTGSLGGPVNVALQALVQAIKFKVKYSVTTDGKPGKFKQTDLSAAKLPDSDPLQAMFLIAPALIEDRLLGTKVTTELVVTVSVEVEGHSVSAPFKIPLPIPPIPLPAFLVLTGGYEPDDEPDNNKVFVMVRTGSTLKDINGAVTTINSVVQALNSVKDVLDLGGGFVPLVGSLTEAVAMITGALNVAGFATDAAPNFDDLNDFDDEPKSSLLFGPVGTAVEFFSGFDFNELALGENEQSTFTITADFSPDPTKPTGFGVHRVTNWRTRNWDTDNSDSMDNDCESCRFV